MACCYIRRGIKVSFMHSIIFFAQIIPVQTITLIPCGLTQKRSLRRSLINHENVTLRKLLFIYCEHFSKFLHFTCHTKRVVWCVSRPRNEAVWCGEPSGGECLGKRVHTWEKILHHEKFLRKLFLVWKFSNLRYWIEFYCRTATSLQPAIMGSLNTW